MSQSTIIVGGKEYTLEGSNLRSLDAWEAFVIGSRPDPFSVLKSVPSDASEEVQKDLARRAFNLAMQPAFVTVEEGAEFDASLRGRTWSLWNKLQAHHAAEFPSMTEAAELLEKLAIKEPGVSDPVAAPQSSEGEPATVP